MLTSEARRAERAEMLSANTTEGSDHPTRHYYRLGEEQPPHVVLRGGQISLRETARGDACDLPPGTCGAARGARRRHRTCAARAAGDGAATRATYAWHEANHRLR